MRPLSSTENPALTFKPSVGQTKIKTRIPGSKIGWMHTIADKKGATFDITVRDALGRTKFERKNCTTDTEKFGELVNHPTQIGEELEVEISNLKGADELQVFLN